ncbi:MAG: hypothetical protein ABIH89_06535 [Elusimicrobiota bacterium]
MNRKKTIKISVLAISAFFIVVAVLIVCSAGEQKTKNEKITAEQDTSSQKDVMEKYNYTGSKYRSPFSASAGAAAVFSEESGEKTVKMTISVDSLKVSGSFSDKKGEYAILTTGTGEYYVVKNGRLYDRDGIQQPDIAAVIKKGKVLLIGKDSKVFEFTIPE